MLLLCACLAAATGLLAPAGAAAQDQAALEEYRLTLSGTEASDIQAPSLIEESADSVGAVGVVGEQDDDFSPISALGAATASPAGVVVALLVIGGIALALTRPRERG